jgi:hypothetical protein
MRAAELSPHELLRAPQLAALAILDAALMAARAALIAEHPDVGLRPRPAAEPARPLLISTARVVAHTAELRHLLTRYRRALDAVHADHADHDRRQAELPF